MAEHITADAPEFSKRWPSCLKIRYPGYAGTLRYANTNGNGWHEDKAAGALNRRWLNMMLKPEAPGGMAAVKLGVGYAEVALTTPASTLTIRQAKDLAAQIGSAIEAAEALNQFVQELIPNEENE